MANDGNDAARGTKHLSRRQVVRGGAVLAALGGTGLAGRAAGAAEQPPSARAPRGEGAPYVPQPGATQHAFSIQRTTLDPDGKKAVPGVTVNGALPGPEIRIREGEQFRVLVENRLDASPTTIHWHGLLVPSGMDGVPQISNLPIAPSQMYVYEYPIRQTGTYWYHSHVGFQEQVGLFGAFVVEELDDPVRADHDAVVLLSDWLHRSPEEVFAQLRAGDGKPGGGMAGMKMADAGAKPDAAAAPKPAKADLSDVAYDAFLLNGKAPAAPWTLAARPGERVRLRIVNAGASTYFRVSLDGHELEVTHADGLAVEPVRARHLLMGMAESYDVVVTLKGPGSYTLHAVAQDGSGQAIGVLHTPDATPEPDRTMPTFDAPPLQYSALRAPASTVLPPGEARAFRLPLQGDMQKYVWMIDGQAWPDASPLEIRRDDRVQLELVNETMMWHPMHLHGHFFRLLNGAGDFCPLKHTVNVAPGETVRIEFTADNPGRWFFHCHNLYHLEAGMARELVYVI